MRHIQRLIAASVLVALSGALAGCAGGNTASSFDPTDMLDFLDQKKPLQGVRKPVFPDGVPGVEQGVPKELYKGNQQSLQQDAPSLSAAPPAPEPKSKRGKKSAPAKPAAAPEASPDADAPAEDAAPAAPPAPKPAKRKRTSPTAIPHDDAAPAAAPAQQQPAPQPQQQMSPFPAPLPSGSFQR